MHTGTTALALATMLACLPHSQIALAAPPTHQPKPAPPAATSDKAQPPSAAGDSADAAHGLSEANTTIIADAAGSAVLLVTYDARGRATDVRIEQTSGSQALDRAALIAARRWRFTPGHLNGKAVGDTRRVPVQFRKR